MCGKIVRPDGVGLFKKLLFIKPSVLGFSPTVNVSKNIKYFILRLIVIYENRILERWENDQLPGSKNPGYSVFPASHGPDKLIGSVNPGYGGSLVGRLYPDDPRKPSGDKWKKCAMGSERKREDRIISNSIRSKIT